MIVAIIISFLVAAPIAYIWVRGIDNMKKNYPDYKGEDLFGWNDEDENKNHTEGNF